MAAIGTYVSHVEAPVKDYATGEQLSEVTILMPAPPDHYEVGDSIYIEFAHFTTKEKNRYVGEGTE